MGACCLLGNEPIGIWELSRNKESICIPEEKSQFNAPFREIHRITTDAAVYSHAEVRQLLQEADST